MAHPDPCSSQHVTDLIRAFRREDDARGSLQDVRIALSSEIIARIRLYGLRQPVNSIELRDCALIEFQYLMGWREASARTVQIQDVDVTSQVWNSVLYYTLSSRLRTLKVLLVRGRPPLTLTCQATATTNPLALQYRYHTSKIGAPYDLYWSYDGNAVPAQTVSQALPRVLSNLRIAPPPFCYYASHSLRSGCATALILQGVPKAIIIRRGGWKTERMVTNVYFDARLRIKPEMEQYFWSLLPRASLTPPR